MDATNIISTEVIKSRIYEIRGRRIMIDNDLSELYGIETKNLKRTVRMNIERFPDDFMFELTKDEYDFLRCNFFTLKNNNKNSRKTPSNIGQRPLFTQYIIPRPERAKA